jgi:hypothetical protein
VPGVLDNDATTERSLDVHPALMEYLSISPLEYVGNNSYAPQTPVAGYEDVATSSTLEQHGYNAQENQHMQSPWQLSFAPSPDFSEHNFREMMMTSDSAGVDEHWMSFMRDTGLLDGIHSGLYGAMPSA